MAKPCPRCQTQLRKAGVNKVWYTTDTPGLWEQLPFYWNDIRINL